MNAIFLDTETTDNDVEKGAQPIQIAWEVIDIDHKEILEGDAMNLRPTVSISPAATCVHGISNEAMKKKVGLLTQDEGAEHLFSVFERYKPGYIIGHKINFDVEILKSLFSKSPIGIVFPEMKVIDTLRLAQKLIPLEKIGNHKQATVLYYLNQTEEQLQEVMTKSHDALADIKMCKKMFLLLCKILSEKLGEKITLDRVLEYNLAPEIVEIWPFGNKHKGKKVVDVVIEDPGYCNWFLTKTDLAERPDLAFTVRTLLEGKYPKKEVRTEFI